MKVDYIKLKDLCKIQSGGTPRRGVSGYYDGEIPWAKIGDIENAQNGYIYKTIETITDVGLKSINNRLFPKNTVLLAMYGSVGKTSIAGIELSTNQAILGLQPKDKETLDFRYLKHWLDYSKDKLIGMARGVALQNISATIVKDFEIPLPSLEAQEQIIKILAESDSLRKKRKESMELMDKYNESVFIEMFGSPVSNPMDWATTKFEELGTLDRGKSKHRPRNAPELLGGKHPLIQTGEVSKANLYIENFTSTYSDIGLKQSKKWPKGTLCITIAANIAKTGILSFDACFPDSVVGFTANTSKTNSVFIHYWMSFFQKILEANAPESAQKNINLRILRELKVITPPIELQNKFKEVVDSSENIKNAMLAQRQQLDNQFQALMQQSFNQNII
jgi:type I restriction enzyme S subunit